MDELVAGSLRSMQAGLAPLKQRAPAASSSEHGSVNQAVKLDLDTACEAVKKEVSSCARVALPRVPTTQTHTCRGKLACSHDSNPCPFLLQVSKIGLMWGGELKPTAAEAAPLLRVLSERVLHLFALYNGIRLAAGAGSTLAADLAQRASGIMTAAKVSTTYLTCDPYVYNPGACSLWTQIGGCLMKLAWFPGATADACSRARFCTPAATVCLLVRCITRDYRAGVAGGRRGGGRSRPAAHAGWSRV